jgi:uncharacterized protein YjbJ (UPF0337 family)
MDKDRIAGVARRAKGSVTEAIAKVADDSKTHAGGAAEKTAGSVQNVIGGVEDTMRDALEPR